MYLWHVDHPIYPIWGEELVRGAGVRERVKINFDLWLDNEMCVTTRSPPPPANNHPLCKGFAHIAWMDESSFHPSSFEPPPGSDGSPAAIAAPAENMENYRKFSVNWFLGLSIGGGGFSLHWTALPLFGPSQGKFMQMAVTAGCVVWMRFLYYILAHCMVCPLHVTQPNWQNCQTSRYVCSGFFRSVTKKLLINVWPQVVL